MTKKRRTRVGMLGLATLLGACLLAGGNASAEEFSGTEGSRIEGRVWLPIPRWAQQQIHSGWTSVRYKVCTEDGTATGATFGGGSVDPEADYLGVCELKMTFTRSDTPFKHYLDVSWPTADDDRPEGDEYFEVKFTDPEVIEWPGTSRWQPYGGWGMQLPWTITLKLTIKDND